MRATGLAAAAAALAVVCAGALAAAPRPVVLRVTPALSVEDEPIAIRVTGLAPLETVTLTLRSTDATGVAFASHAAYRADRHGVVDTSRTSPLPGGSYTTAWSSGLLPSMKALTGSPFALYVWGDAVRSFRLVATVGGRVVATRTFHRRWADRPYSVRNLTVAKNGIYGTFYAPPGARHRPAVLAFGGSEGAAADHGGATEGRLASYGIPTLFVGYFHGPGLPDRLVNIPLEYFRKALLWLDRQPQVDPARVTLSTGSYGSEAALLVGVHYSSLVHGIVATVPGSVVTCGIMGADRRSPTPNACLGSPWSLGGRPLPHTTLLDQPHPWDTPAAVIPVARIRAPLLLACAGNDELWSSCTYAEAIVAARRGHGEQTTLLRYPRAGHYVGSASEAYDPGAMQSDLFTPWSELGREDLWPRTIAFFRRGG